jgi:tripartite-type tricarboxylate transporter receptor subunit TctC
MERTKNPKGGTDQLGQALKLLMMTDGDIQKPLNVSVVYRPSAGGTHMQNKIEMNEQKIKNVKLLQDKGI